MATFELSNEYDVPIKIAKNGAKSFDREKIKQWAKEEELLGLKGVYIFSIRAGRGVKPWYVGKTEKQNFLKEAFNPRNAGALYDVINNQKGTLVIQFITQVRSRGVPNMRQVGEIEFFLIGHASERNKNLLNNNGVKKSDWVIKGVYNSGRGKRTKRQIEFCKLMGI